MDLNSVKSNRISKDEMWMQVAEVIAQRSSATKRKVGAVAVDENGYVLSTGYNGTLPGTDNTCEDPVTNKTYPHVIHAEDNMCRRLDDDSLVYAFYVTTAPCFNCAVKMSRFNPAIVYYDQEFKNNDGLMYLEDYGIEVVKLRRE